MTLKSSYPLEDCAIYTVTANELTSKVVRGFNAYELHLLVCLMYLTADAVSDADGDHEEKREQVTLLSNQITARVRGKVRAELEDDEEDEGEVERIAHRVPEPSVSSTRPLPQGDWHVEVPSLRVSSTPVKPGATSATGESIPKSSAVPVAPASMSHPTTARPTAKPRWLANIIASNPQESGTPAAVTPQKRKLAEEDAEEDEEAGDGSQAGGEAEASERGETPAAPESSSECPFACSASVLITVLSQGDEGVDEGEGEGEVAASRLLLEVRTFRRQDRRGSYLQRFRKRLSPRAREPGRSHRRKPRLRRPPTSLKWQKSRRELSGPVPRHWPWRTRTRVRRKLSKMAER